jgi:hypothetical protein
MRRRLAVLLVVHVLALATACGPASVGGGPAAEPMEKDGFVVHPMITIAVFAAAILGFAWFIEETRKPAKSPPE